MTLEQTGMTTFQDFHCHAFDQINATLSETNGFKITSNTGIAQHPKHNKTSNPTQSSSFGFLVDFVGMYYTPSFFIQYTPEK